jgi:hypothetical protein
MPVIPLEALNTWENMPAATGYSRASRSKPSDLAKIGDTMTATLWPPRTYRGRPVEVTGAVVAATCDAFVLVTAGGYFTVRAQDARSD